MTTNLGHYYAVEVQRGVKTGSRWLVLATVFRRDSRDTVATVNCGGETRDAAEQEAIRQARHWADEEGQPKDWSPREAPPARKTDDDG